MLLLGDAVAPRRRQALVVRIGEKRILHGALAKVSAAQAAEGAAAPKGDQTGKKRKGPDTGAMSVKKTRH